MDEIAKLADNCEDRGRDKNFASVYEAIYDWVLPWNLRYRAQPLVNVSREGPYACRCSVDENV